MSWLLRQVAAKAELVAPKRSAVTNTTLPIPVVAVGNVANTMYSLEIGFIAVKSTPKSASGTIAVLVVVLLNRIKLFLTLSFFDQRLPQLNASTFLT